MRPVAAKISLIGQKTVEVGLTTDARRTPGLAEKFSYYFVLGYDAPGFHVCSALPRFKCMQGISGDNRFPPGKRRQVPLARDLPVRRARCPRRRRHISGPGGRV